MRCDTPTTADYYIYRLLLILLHLLLNFCFLLPIHQVMGGRSSSFFSDYTTLCVQALTEIRKHSEAVIILMEIMTHKSSFPAFRSVVADLGPRFLVPCVVMCFVRNVRAKSHPAVLSAA